MADRADRHTAYVWVTEFAGVDQDAAQRYREILSPDELARAQGCRLARDHRAFVISHGLLRSALTWVRPEVAPNKWNFVSNETGRPEIGQPTLLPKLRFSISHADGLAACIVTTEIDCGIDAERVVPLHDLKSLSERVLSPSEIAEAGKLPADKFLWRFYRLWTLKEAYVKARGLAPLLPFHQLTFTCHGSQIRVHLNPEIDDRGPWHFEQWKVGPDHIVSLAAQRQAKQPFHVVRCHSKEF